MPGRGCRRSEQRDGVSDASILVSVRRGLGMAPLPPKTGEREIQGR